MNRSIERDKKKNLVKAASEHVHEI